MDGFLRTNTTICTEYLEETQRKHDKWFEQVEEDLTAYKLAKLEQDRIKNQKYIILTSYFVAGCLTTALIIFFAILLDF